MSTKVISSAPSSKSGKQGNKETKKHVVPDNQWDLPAGISSDGTRLVTLREVVNPKVPTTASLVELNSAQRAQIVEKRIEAQPKFSISMVGVGTVDKERAIAEVKAGSKIGLSLIEIEQRLLSDMIRRATA